MLAAKPPWTDSVKELLDSITSPRPSLDQCCSLPPRLMTPVCVLRHVTTVMSGGICVSGTESTDY